MWSHGSWKHGHIRFITKIRRNFIQDLLVLRGSTASKEPESFFVAAVIATFRRAAMMNKDGIIIVTDLFYLSCNIDLRIIMSVSVWVHIKKLGIELQIHCIPQVMSSRCALLNSFRWVIINNNPLARVHLVLLSKRIVFTRLFIIETVAIFLGGKLMSFYWMILIRALLWLFLNLRWEFGVFLVQISRFWSIQTFFLITGALLYSMIHALNGTLLVDDRRWPLRLAFETAFATSILTFGEIQVWNQLRALLVDIIDEPWTDRMLLILARVEPWPAFFLPLWYHTCHIS